MVKPSLTVLMTVYNGQRYLCRAVESVIKQSYSDFEFLIVDDASKDKSVDILRSYQDPRIRIVQNLNNQGQTVSLNIGLRAARGEYIARIDADDIAFPHWLQSQINFLEKNGRVDVLSAGLVTFSEKGLGKTYFSPSCREDILLKSIIKTPVNHGSALIKRDAILGIGGYNSSYKIAADYDVWTNLLRQGKSIVSNPDIVMAIRRHTESESEKNKSAYALKELAEISCRHIRFLTGMDLTEKESLLMCRAHYDGNGLNVEDFLRAVQIHKKIYASLRQDLNLNKTKAEFWYKKQARTFFLKRIHGYVLQHNRLEVRLAAQSCLRKLGFDAVFAGLYFFSFFPQQLLDFFLKTHYFIHMVAAMAFCRRATQLRAQRYPSLKDNQNMKEKKVNLKLVLSMISRNLIYCDVGARDGINDPWQSFRDCIDLVSFEPDQEEYDRLMMVKRGNDSLYKYALSKEHGDVRLNLTKERGCSSVLEPNRNFLNGFPNSERFEVEKSITVKTTTLDTLYKDGILPNIDFIKIDVQGSELDILTGAVNFLKDHVLGIEVEVEFQPLYQNQPFFSDIDHFIRNSIGLQVQDLRKTYWKYSEGIRIGGPKGKLMFGDVLYFRSPHEIISWSSIFHRKEASNKIQMACLMGVIYGYLDYSMCLLKQQNICDFIAYDVVDKWVSFIYNYGRAIRYMGKGSSGLASIFKILYRIFQPEQGRWASIGHHLGMRRRFGIFY